MAKNGKPNWTRHTIRGALWMRRSYNCIDKDPEIDTFRTIWQKEHIKESDLAVIAGLSESTVKNMFGGETRQPRHSTFAKMAGALGYKYKLIRDDDDKPDYEKEIPKAKQERKVYRTLLAQQREKQR